MYLSVIEFTIDFKLDEMLTTLDQYGLEGYPPTAIIYSLNLMEVLES